MFCSWRLRRLPSLSSGLFEWFPRLPHAQPRPRMQLRRLTIPHFSSESRSTGLLADQINTAILLMSGRLGMLHNSSFRLPARLPCNASWDHVVLEYATAVYISAVEIYQSYSPTQSMRIWADQVRCRPESLLLLQGDGQWVRLSDESAETVPTEYFVYKPTICRPGFRSQRLKVEVSSCKVGQSGWPTIDAVKIRGTLSAPYASRSPSDV